MDIKEVKDLVSGLKEKAKQQEIEVFVPSLGASVPFLPLSVAQQKQIIKHTLGGPLGAVKMTVTFNDIITANNITRADINITDRNAILLQLRANTAGLIVAGEDGTVHNLKYPKITQDYDSVHTIEDNGITVVLETPSIRRDNQYYASLLARIEKDKSKLDDMLVETYVMEISKFIKTITIDEQVFSNTGILDSAVVDSLPTTLINKIAAHIKTAKTFDSSLLVLENGEDVSLNARFFCDIVD